MNSNSNTLAIPFITYNQGKGFSISSQAEEFLNSLPQQRELAVLSIVGKYRTGKSFFVNRVLLQQKKGGFQVGPTINPCTKGLWLWKKTIQSPTNADMDVIVIDTEGFGGMDENANHDSRIFLFSLLLSSYFIYNSVGSIDENALNTLNLIINLAKDIQTKTGNESCQDFPSFLWVVRDFTLKLVDKSQNQISSKQYLQNALQFQKGGSDAIESKNKIRRLFKHFFRERDCCVMVRPTEKEKDLQKLDQIDNQMLRPQFVKQVESIRTKIYHSVKAKRINGRPLNGKLLSELCKGYMETINKGMLPNIESAWFYVCRSEGLKAIKQANNYLQEQISKLSIKPRNNQELQKYKQQIKQRVIQIFKKKSLGAEDGQPDLVQKLQKKIEENWVEMKRKNKSSWAHQYKQIAQVYIEQLKQKVYGEQYNDFSEFIKEFQEAKHAYNQKTVEGDQNQKWVYFNELSENVYRLAAETITKKINNYMLQEKQFLEKKVKSQEEELQKKTKQTLEEKAGLKQRLSEMERQNAKLQALQETSSMRINQFKNQYDTLYEKYKKLYEDNEATLLQVEQAKREARKNLEQQFQESRNQANVIKSNLDKERTLFEMEKKYLQEEITRYKDRCSCMQTQIRKLKTNNARLHSQLQQLEIRLQQKKEQMDVLQQTNSSYSRKIEGLLVENSRKGEILGDQSEWLLQKSYLQNQVSFLKSTLSENKRLYDALLISLQQSIVSTQGECNNELIEANKNMSMALQKVQLRCQILQQKYNKLKQIKKMLKNCTSLQCISCLKWIHSTQFNEHIQICIQQNRIQRNKDIININISQVIHETQDKKKSFTQYHIKINLDNYKWKVIKRYKQFTILQQALIHRFPSIKYPNSCNFLADINVLVNHRKNMIAEERRKSLQQYLRDLSKIDQIRHSDLFIKFLEIDKIVQTKSNNKGNKTAISVNSSTKKQKYYN